MFLLVFVRVTEISVHVRDVLRDVGSYRKSHRKPPSQALRFSRRRGERETRVTGDEPQGTMGRIKTAGVATSPPLSPSRLPLRTHFHRERDVWVRGRKDKQKISSSPFTFSRSKQIWRPTKLFDGVQLLGNMQFS